MSELIISVLAAVTGAALIAFAGWLAMAWLLAVPA